MDGGNAENTGGGFSANASALAESNVSGSQVIFNVISFNTVVVHKKNYCYYL